METSQSKLDQIFAKVCNKLKIHDQWLYENFLKLSSNFDRFKFIFHLPIAHKEIDTLIDQFAFEPKNSKVSQEYRVKGNELFKSKNFQNALIQYNKSIKLARNPKLKISKKTATLTEITSSAETEENEAEKPEEELAFAYANRSAVFFHLNEFDLCLKDIEKAFEYNYPETIRKRLIERKVQSYFKLDLFDELKQLLAEETCLEPEFIQTYSEKIQELQRNIYYKKEPAQTWDPKVVTDYGSIKFSIPDKDKNSKLLNASNSISMNYTIHSSFHIKSNRKIEVGDVVLDEPAYASVLLGKYFTNYCYECFKGLNVFKMNITYCRQCSVVNYCSPQCEKNSWSMHKYECKYINLLGVESGLTHMEWLAMRIVLKATYPYLTSIKDSLIDHEKKFEILIRDESSIVPFDQPSRDYRSDSYFNIFHLITNSALRKTNDLFRRAFIALFMSKILQKTGFIINDSKDNICFIGGLILRHMQQISCNAHEISQLKLDDTKKLPLASSLTEGIGAGIYAILSLFNHSCDPHVTRNFLGTRCQLRAIRTVNKDEEVFDNYGVVYAVQPIDERQDKLLSQYFFECRCGPCMDDWPKYDQIPNDLLKLSVKCNECKMAKKKSKNCSNCEMQMDELRLDQTNAKQSLKGLLSFNWNVDLADPATQGGISIVFEAFCKYLHNLHSLGVKRPFQDYNNFEEAIKQCLNLVHLKYE